MCAIVHEHAHSMDVSLLRCNHQWSPTILNKEVPVCILWNNYIANTWPCQLKPHHSLMIHISFSSKKKLNNLVMAIPASNTQCCFALLYIQSTFHNHAAFETFTSTLTSHIHVLVRKYCLLHTVKTLQYLGL